MVVTRYQVALILAGFVGSGGAVVHGLLTQSHIVAPVTQAASGRIGPMIQRLVAVLLQFSTFHWFVGGLAVAASCALGREARLAIGLLVGSSYLFATLGNLWATEGRHPGWVVYGAALALIAYGLADPRA